MTLSITLGVFYLVLISGKYKNIIVTSRRGQSQYYGSQSGKKWGIMDCNTTRWIFRGYDYFQLKKILTTKNVWIAPLKTRFF